MRIESALMSAIGQNLALLLLRVSTGFLLVWTGLSKIVRGKAPFQVRRNFELDETTNLILGYGAGSVQLLIGACCVIGLWRRLMLPAQALIHGFTAASVWWAIIDPYRWYIEDVDRIVFNSHVFYPTSITFAACIVLIALRERDRIALDRFLSGQRREQRPPCTGEIRARGGARSSGSGMT